MSNPSNPAVAQNFKAGDKLASCYTLKEILPVEGFCIVWLAHDEELNKDIALHFIPDAVAADARAMSELKQEAKRNRQLIHPRIVRVHDLVEDEKWAAISMDHVQGETLSTLQKKHEKNAFNPSEIAAGISEICQTLEDAHRIDLFHRDLTPENLIATANGVMIQKFGLSRVILDSLVRGGQPIEGARDIACISPQQLDARPPTRADDIYSLASALFDLLTGTPPFAEGDIISQTRKAVPPLVSERRAARGITAEPVPKAWDDTIAACLAKTPDERPKSAAEAGSRFASERPGAAPVPVPPTAAAAGPAASQEAPRTPEQSGQPVQEPAARQQKRPWGSGPGKTPSITEVTVLSKTSVPRGEKDENDEKDQSGKESTGDKPAAPVAAGAGAKRGGPTTPTGFPLRAFVEVDDGPKGRKNKTSGGMIAAGAVLLLIIVIGYLVYRNNGSSGNPAPEAAVATTGSGSEMRTASSESAATPVLEESASPVPSPVNLAANVSPAPADAAPSAPAEPAPSAPAAVAQSPAPIAVAGLAALTEAQADQLIADKTKAVDQAMAALADAEKASKDKASAQAQAAAAVQDLQAAIKEKTAGTAAAKKAADDAAAAIKQLQDTSTKAQEDAADAKKAADSKAQAAEQAQKAVADAEAAAGQQTAELQKTQADADQAAKSVADRQKAADAAARDAAAAEKVRDQQAQALAQAQSDLGQVQAGLQQAQQIRAAQKASQAAAEAARIRKAREAETAKLTAQAAAAAQVAADAQKALDAAKKAVADAEKAQHDAEQQAAALRNGGPAAPSVESPVPATESASPAMTPPAGAAASPASPANAPSLIVRANNPHLKVDQALTNSLGMRFAPVGNVFFCIWLTRVEDFEAFAKATGYKGSAWRDPGFKQGPDHPVVNVSWNDANQFCLWLTEKEHREGILAANETYRLPTDLEWSNAVGLPTETGRTPESRDMDVPDVYPWGTQWPPSAGAGNYTGEETDSDVAIKGYNDGFAWTSPVGSFRVNKFGLYDMGGNVWEWCADWWNGEQKAKVLRGGSWYNGALKLSLLSSCRIHASADQGTDNYGFRVVIAQEASKPRKHGG